MPNADSIGIKIPQGEVQCDYYVVDLTLNSYWSFRSKYTTFWLRPASAITFLKSDNGDRKTS